MVNHTLATIWRHHTQLETGVSIHLVQVGLIHSPRMESRNLVVVQVRVDEGLGRIGVLYLLYVRSINAALVHPLPVGAEILPQCGRSGRTSRYCGRWGAKGPDVQLFHAV